MAGGEARVLCSAFGSDDEEACERSYHSAVERLSDLVRRCETAKPYPITADAASVTPAAAAVTRTSERII